PASSREAVAGVVSVLCNVAQPFSVPEPQRPPVSASRWRTVCDLTNLVYYYESTTHPGLMWMRLRDFDFSAEAPVRKLDLVGQPERVGDVAKQFAESRPFPVPVLEPPVGAGKDKGAAGGEPRP